MSVPTTAAFEFSYGPDSFERHCAEAGRLGLRVRVVRVEGLGWDIDEPGDLDTPAHLGRPARSRDVNGATTTSSSTDLAVPSSALVIVAHPDDAEFQAGATLAKWARQGCAVHHLVLTDGSKGTWDPTADIDELVARRRSEQLAASAALGGTGVEFLGHVDGELDADRTTRARVCAVIRAVRPQVVLGHDPWKRYRLHPDHRAAGQLCIDGIVAARDPFFHADQLLDGVEPHRPDALLLFEADVVNHHEQVDEVDLAAKLAALEAHTSQMVTTHFYKVGEGDPLERFRALQRDKLETIGAAIDAGSGLAEAFHLIVDQL